MALYQTPEVANEDTTITSERLPTLSNVTFSDLTSLLVKTGRAVELDCPYELEQVNLTEQLGPAHDGSMDDTMEELESLMLKLEQVVNQLQLTVFALHSRFPVTFSRDSRQFLIRFW